MKESGGASRVFRARARHHFYATFCAYRRVDAVFPVLRARADPYERQDRIFVFAHAIFVSACQYQKRRDLLSSRRDRERGGAGGLCRTATSHRFC